MEFLDKESVDNALKLDDSMFKGRQLKVRLIFLQLSASIYLFIATIERQLQLLIID